MATFLPPCRCMLCRTVHGLTQLWCNEEMSMFLAAARWGRHACAIWAVPPMPFGALFSMNRLGKREFHMALSFVSSSTFSVSHFQVVFSMNWSLRCQGVGCLLHDCIELHIAARSSCRRVPSCISLGTPAPLPVSSAVHQQQFLPFTRGLLPGLTPRSAV